MAEWTHLFSYRTQKLSIPAATIVGPAPCEDSSLPVPFSDHTIAFFVLSVVCYIEKDVPRIDMGNIFDLILKRHGNIRAFLFDRFRSVP